MNPVKTMIDWGSKVAPFFIAVPMAIFGVQHFIYLQFVSNFIPAWIPWRAFWACFTGVALVAAALGIAFKVWDRRAATLLGVMIFLWVLLLHTSRIAAQPGEFAEWRGIFQALAMSGCAFALAGSLAGRMSRGAAPAPGIAPAMLFLSQSGASLAPWFIGLAMVALGLEHFIFSNVASPQVPVWIPGTVIGNYLTGAILLACGAGICFPGTRRASAAALAAVIFTSMLLFHLPVALRGSRFESDWTKTLVLSGGAILLARLSEKRAGEPAFGRLENS